MKLALFLDCYGVLYIRTLELYIILYPELERDISDLYKAFNFSGLSANEFVDELAGLTGEPAEQVRSKFSNSLSLNLPLLDAIKLRLMDKYDVYVMSNTTRSDLDRLCEREELVSLPVKAWYSSEILGATKPSPESFSRVQGYAGKVQQAVLVDDLIQNVEGAKLAGWGSVHYTKIEEVISSLEEIYNARTA